MKELLEVNQMVYSILKTQIEFGAYGHGEQLPPIEEMAELLIVSIDTVRLACRQLQQEGYITLSQNIGTVVKVHFSEDEIEKNIQIFFSKRRETLFDICRSLPVLFSDIQLAAWKNISAEDLNNLENHITNRQMLPPYLIILCVQTVYGSIKNDLLVRLIRRLCIAYMVPFLSLKDCEKYVNCEICAIPEKIKLCRRGNWTALQEMTGAGLKEDYLYLKEFYKTRITVPVPEVQTAFTWSSYKKTSQICYSVGIEIVSMIIRGTYPVGSFLPSLKNLAKEKHVSVSTIRHTVALLNDLGIVKTMNGIGTQILSMDQAVENCDLSSRTLQKRLLDCKQSLQIFTLSCRRIAAFTISSIDDERKAQWMEQMLLFERSDKLDLISPLSLEFISQSAPYQTIRTVYTELYKQLLWGVPLRSMMGTQKMINTFYRPYYHTMVDCLKKSDAEGFAASLEEILYYEAELVAERLRELGIHEEEPNPSQNDIM